MAPGEGRGGDLCVYLVSCVLLLAIVSGGAFLAVYIALPASDATAWFLVAGMVLVSTPWVFWTATCLYRALSMRRATRGGGADRPPAGRPAGGGGRATVAMVAQEDAAVDYPGGARRVRFGGAIVLGGSQEAPPGVAPPEDEGGSAAAAAAADGSSHTSHESELPLFMSS
ncbi:unnamed protein product [Spirodela intermedia]|uniref:Uncharacterized protein n=1 Tax=Spirodela intermedia TaxID=51605 RepID=A0A7I8KRA3_SPIIN|nr:unnamed protein product [Spirodela intermedia]